MPRRMVLLLGYPPVDDAPRAQELLNSPRHKCELPHEGATPDFLTSPRVRFLDIPESPSNRQLPVLELGYIAS